MVYLAVAAGSAAGGALRYALSVAFAGAFPLPTLIVNVVGSFLIGAFLAATEPGGGLPVSATARALLIPGFCGGLTTFSAFGADTMLLWSRSPARAASYVALSVGISILAVWIGTLAGRPR